MEEQIRRSAMSDDGITGDFSHEGTGVAVGKFVQRVAAASDSLNMSVSIFHFASQAQNRTAMMAQKLAAATQYAGSSFLQTRDLQPVKAWTAFNRELAKENQDLAAADSAIEARLARIRAAKRKLASSA